MKHRKLSSGLCDDLEGWGWGSGVGGRLKRAGVYVRIRLIHFTVWQKLTQHRRVIIFQLKTLKLKKF